MVGKGRVILTENRKLWVKYDLKTDVIYFISQEKQF
jgi:hypothetical protein